MPMPCPRTSRSSSTETRPGWPTSSWPRARTTASSEATRTVDASFVYSDHSPFWDNGYPALLAIEDNPLTNPYYHRTTDTLDTLNIDFFTSATRASVGLLAELAQPIKAGYPRTPVGLYAESVVYRSLFNSLQAIRLTWDAQTDAEGYNIYRSSTPHVGYVKISTTPVTGTTFTDNDIIFGTDVLLCHNGRGSHRA